MTRDDTSGSLAFPVVLAALYTASLGLVAVLGARGLPFYLLPLAERAHDEGYWVWKSGGTAGHPMGWAGSAAMIVMLGYSARKRIRGLRRLGPLSRWLDVHILLGIVGPLFIVLHSALKVRGLVALSFWSMAAVALSGIVGRYLYLQIPRTRAGEVVSLAALEEADRTLARRLREEFGLGDEALARLDRLTEPPPRAGLLRAAAGTLAGDLPLRRRVAAFVRESGVPPRVARSFESLARLKARSRRRIRLFDRLQALFHYWHVFHKPFAVVMYVFMLVHVAVALSTGYAGSGR